jgi:phosphomevalonate kinase
MSGALRASAPGKLVLLGEYAVVDGAPAVVAAVDRRARVTATPAPGGSWSVTAPGLQDEPAAFTLGPAGEPCWRRAADAGRLPLLEGLLSAWTGLAGSEAPRLPPLALELDTRAFFERCGAAPAKLGLGSSAALTVALAAVLARAAGAEPGPAWMERLVSMHRGLQGGRGSGVDVAASLLGGVLEYARDPASGAVTTAPLELPPGLGLRCLWTGRPASTAGFLERLEARRAAAPERVGGALAILGAAARDGAAAARAGDAAAFAAAVAASWAGFEALGAVLELPLLSAEHRALKRLADGCGVAYKPSGAGGGDLGLAVAAQPERLDELVSRARAAGFTAPGLALGAAGLDGNGMENAPAGVVPL